MEDKGSDVSHNDNNNIVGMKVLQSILCEVSDEMPSTSSSYTP